MARIDAAREQVRVTERQIDVERTNLDNTIVRAPFAGIAVSKDAQPGEMVSPNSAGGGFTRTGICTLVDMRSLEIEVDVNETYINRVEDKQPVTAVLNAYPDWQIPAHVITTVPKADRQKATVLVRIGFEALDPRILPDMGVKVTFMKQAAAGRRQRVATDLAGAEGCRPRREQPVVRLCRSTGDVVDRRAVRTAGTDGDRVEVIAGLASGERVIVAPAAGARVGCDRCVERGGGAMSETPLVRIRDVHKFYSRGTERIDVLKGVSLEIPAGDFLALMGPSGSGKTTLLNMLGGIDTPTQGLIEVGGVSIGNLSRRRAVAMALAARRLRVPAVQPAACADRGAQRRTAAAADEAVALRAPQARRLALKVVGLAERAKHYPRQLSGGQEQRVGIARAIVTDPTLLLCDEPTGDLDRKAGDEILELLQTLNREYGKTIVMVTHDPHAADRARRTLHLEKGVLVESVTA